MISFQTKEQAKEFLDTDCGMEPHSGGRWYSPSGYYYLGHNEYCRPDYQPRKYEDGWGIHVRYYHYAGAIGVPEDGRVDPSDWLIPDNSMVRPEQIHY